MPYKVLLTAGAERDLEALYDYIAHRDSKASANRVLDRLLKIAGDLAIFPERGSHPRELLALGIHQYRQVFFKPYRLIYRIIRTEVVVYLIADGRRDMQTLLSQRLLGGPN
ncbi:MAG: type II toxin-antitoxin system RelE/ParE family toxin [Thiobacillus sp.]|nr:type II toxin-antitoxin system RelE/ParE family toxin [Thiobacillus sp.]MDP2978862.1 type II toxin-antitoxin system RelE/ParE family toxin [Thiobacillus sp.]